MAKLLKLVFKWFRILWDSLQHIQALRGLLQWIGWWDACVGWGRTLATGLLSSIVFASRLAWPFLLVAFLVAWALLLFIWKTIKPKLKSPASEGQRELVGELEAVCIAEVEEQVWALFKIRLINQGPPSAADGWVVEAISGSSRYHGSLVDINKVIQIPGQYETVHPNDSIYHKAMNSPIATGAMVWGWLAVGFGKVDHQTIASSQFGISFTDSFRNRKCVRLVRREH